MTFRSRLGGYSEFKSEGQENRWFPVTYFWIYFWVCHYSVQEKKEKKSIFRKSTRKFVPAERKSDEWIHTFGLVGIQRKERELSNPVACNDAGRLEKDENQQYLKQLRTFQRNISIWSNVQVTLNFQKNAQRDFLIFLLKTSCRKLSQAVIIHADHEYQEEVAKNRSFQRNTSSYSIVHMSRNEKCATRFLDISTQNFVHKAWFMLFIRLNHEY